MASVSKAQIRANRQNAKRSTGPKTDQGKVIASKNAITHGVYAQSFMNEVEETHYQLFLDELKQSYPSKNPLIKAQLERFAKTKTILDRIQRTLSATFAISELPSTSDEALMDLLEMDQDQRKIARQFANGSRDIGDIINVRKLRVAAELTHIDTTSFVSHDDYLYHTPHLCKYLFDEANKSQFSIDKFIAQSFEYAVTTNEIREKLLKLLDAGETKKDADIDIFAPYPPPKNLEKEIQETSIANLQKAAELFKEEHNKLADIHHKVITFNKLRKFDVSPIPLNFDHLDKLFRIQGSLQNQYSKILGELLEMTSNQYEVSL